MPTLWKKAKVSRITRLVADLQPPRSGNSLVVETGFPTSLVDLFVKNRERLKKPIKKKKKQQQKQQQQSLVVEEEEEEEEFVISDPIPLSSSRDLPPSEPIFIDDRKFEWPDNFSVHRQNVQNSGVSLDSNLDIKNCDSSGGGGGGDACCDLKNNCKFNGKEKQAIIAILHIFPMVILALSTKRLAVGITMSAFLLIFLEFIVKRFFLEKPSWFEKERKVLWCWISKPFRYAKMGFRGLIEKGFSLFRKDRKVEKKEEIDRIVFDSFDFDHSREYFDENSEWKKLIERSSSKESNQKEENQTILELLNNDRKWGSLEENYCPNSNIKKKILRRLMPKKLRVKKKGKKEKEKEKENDLSGEASSCGEGEGEKKSHHSSVNSLDSQEKSKGKLWKLLEEVQPEEGMEKGNQEFDSNEEKQIAGVRRISSSKSEMILVEERVDFERGGSSGYLILFLIVLAGLVGGRILALVVTVGSCSMLKLVWRRRKCINEVPPVSS